jgi:hypothetical protein
LVDIAWTVSGSALNPEPRPPPSPDLGRVAGFDGVSPGFGLDPLSSGLLPDVERSGVVWCSGAV